MEIAVLTALAALVLAVEKATYWWVWRSPQRFAAWYPRQPLLGAFPYPVSAFERLFHFFKAVQLVVYGGWIVWFSVRTEWLPNDDRVGIGLALVLIAVGQALNMAVFARLGRVGTFYGVRFGQSVQWIEGFPFSVVPHPQYTGTVLSIWGLFLLTRFPQPDWIALPLVSTVYYAFNAWFEREEPEAPSGPV